MRVPNATARQALPRALRAGPTGIADLAAALGVTSRSVLRWLREQPEQICTAGAASRTRYALRRPLRGQTASLPLYRIDERGQAHEAGSLAPVEPQGTLCDWRVLDWPRNADARDGWWPGLPYPLYDMQPQGFLGRAFAQAQHAALDVSPDPSRWNDDDILFVLSRAAPDTSGNLIVGDASLRLWQQTLAAPPEQLPEAVLLEAYRARARETTALGLGGSSAAGEFPKFTAERELAGAQTGHVIVKFSGDVTPGATQRWSDLLVCEHLALAQAAQLPGITACRTRLLQDVRTFLEAERFDRHGRFGRSPFVSLSGIDGHLLGLGADWPIAAQRLAALQLLTNDDVHAVCCLWWYGRLIANTDMHAGNLGFVPEVGQFRLAPAYDMLPMAYAPLAGGEVPDIRPDFAQPLPTERVAWLAACTCALAFWQQAGDDARISAPFRDLCRENQQRLASLRERVAPT